MMWWCVVFVVFCAFMLLAVCCFDLLCVFVDACL